MTLCICLLLVLCCLRPVRWLSLKFRPIRRKRAPSAPTRGFRPAPPRRSGGRPKPRWVLEEVLRLYAEIGSYRQALYAFHRLHAHTGVTVCLSTVHDWVQQHASEMEAVRRVTRNRLPRWAPANLRWCLDGTGKQDAQGVIHFILGIADYGTRLNLVLKRLEHASASVILHEINLAIEQFGKPGFLRTDNAPVFHSRIFEQGLAALDIRHEFSEPGKPWQNGRIERFFLTLKQKLDQIVIEDGAVLDRLLPPFSFWYNTVRPHQHLHGYTPGEVWGGIDPYGKAPKAVLRCYGWDGLLLGFYLRR